MIPTPGRIWSVGLLVLLAAARGSAQTPTFDLGRLVEGGSPLQAHRVFDLTVDDAIERALDRNLDIAVERLNPQLQNLSIADQNGNGPIAYRVFVGQKGPPVRGGDAERFEEPFRHERCQKHLRLIATREIHGCRLHGRQLIKTRCLRAPVEEVRGSHVSRLIAVLGVGLPHRDDAIRIGKRGGCSSTASTTEDMVVAAPMPRARVKTVEIVKPGFLRSTRRPKRTSWRSWPKAAPGRVCRTESLTDSTLPNAANA